MANFYGIIVYEINQNGNLLNGIYTNNRNHTGNHYHIDNEIARKIPNDQQGLEGTYECRYIENGNPNVINGTLTITRQEEVYEFWWTESGNLIWVGLGLMAGDAHIAVSYTRP